MVNSFDLISLVHHFNVEFFVFRPLLCRQHWLESYGFRGLIVQGRHLRRVDWWLVDSWRHSSLFLVLAGSYVQWIVIRLLWGLYHFDLVSLRLDHGVKFRGPSVKLGGLGWLRGVNWLFIFFRDYLVLILILGRVRIWHVVVGSYLVLVDCFVFHVCWCLYGFIMGLGVLVFINYCFLWVLDGHAIGWHWVHILRRLVELVVS